MDPGGPVLPDHGNGPFHGGTLTIESSTTASSAGDELDGLSLTHLVPDFWVGWIKVLPTNLFSRWPLVRRPAITSITDAAIVPLSGMPVTMSAVGWGRWRTICNPGFSPLRRRIPVDHAVSLAK